MRIKFNNFLEILDYFKDEDRCKKVLVLQRWNNIPVCHHCGNEHIYITNRGYKCGTCLKKFSITVGTIFENSKIKLRLWFAAIYLQTAHKKGISSYQLARDLGVTQKTAWFMLHRIREMINVNNGIKLQGHIEVDETFIGGKISNKHKKERKKWALRKLTLGNSEKISVVGMLERQGEIRFKVIPGQYTKNSEVMEHIVKSNLYSGSILITDGNIAYKGLKDTYQHETVNHGKDEFVRGTFHTNTLEGFWSLLKRGIHGIYHQISIKHLTRYCNEYAYRYNTKHLSDNDRFINTLKMVDRTRLKYNDLILKNAA